MQELVALLTAAAPLTAGLGALVERPGAGFGLAFDDGTEIVVEAEGATGGAVATALVGPLPMPTRADALEALLSYNGLWDLTGGAWFALSEGREVLLLARLEAGGDPGEAARLLGNLAALAGRFRPFVARGGREADADAPAPFAPVAMMRV